MRKKLSAKVRFNTNFPQKSSKKWRIIIDGVEHLVDEIQSTCKMVSTEDIVKDESGKNVFKYHISFNAKSIEFQTRKGITKAILK